MPPRLGQGGRGWNQPDTLYRPMLWPVRASAPSPMIERLTRRTEKGKPDRTHGVRAHLEHLILLVLHAHSPRGGQSIRPGNPKSDALSTELRARCLRWFHAHFYHLARHHGSCSTDRASRGSDSTAEPLGEFVAAGKGPSVPLVPPGRRHSGRRQCLRWYHTSVDKTTIYLPAELRSAVKRAARRRGISEAEVIRDSIRSAVGAERPRPQGSLFASGAPVAREADDHLPGFGER
jgi:hypothetical protein